jgi:uncharacterized protein (TIGR00730 family)
MIIQDLKLMMRKITVFCGPSAGNNEAYIQATDHLVKVLVEQEISLVYGGDNVGLMGRLVNGVLRRGGEVIGVIPEESVSKALVRKGVSVLHIVNTMQERNVLMAELCDGFIALPCGLGTLDEIIEVFSWTQPGNHNKPFGLLNIAGYYDKLLKFMQAMVYNKFLKAEQKDLLIVEKNPLLMVRQMQETAVEYVDKWLK